jgi:hypothetical protein
MKKLIIGLALVALLLVPAACAAEEQATGTSSPDIAPTPTPSEGTWDGEEVSNGTDLSTTDTERMIVRTGNMSLVVEDITQAVEDISQMSTALDGYVVSSSIYGEEEDMRGWISFRVPDDKFETALTQLRDMAVRVESESTSSEDVTEEYIDLEARLGNAKATEAQYLALLDKAVDVEDILSIYNYLSQIRYDIEQIKGRMQYLEKTTSTSLIDVSLAPETTTKPLVRVGWNIVEVLKSAARGLIVAGQVLATIAIWILIFIPVWGTILGIILWRRHKRQAQK